MKTSKVHLATSSAEVSEYTQAALSKSTTDIILVPVDFSSHSEAALIEASRFAQMMPAKLLVLHVVHDPGEMPGYYSKLIKKKRATRMQDVAAEVFQEFMENVIEAHPELTALQEAEVLMVIGLPVTRILEVVDQVNPLLVVLGSQGRTGLKKLVLGSKAAQLVHLCPVPITIVKKSR